MRRNYKLENEQFAWQSEFRRKDAEAQSVRGPNKLFSNNREDMSNINYNNRIFRSVQNTETGEVSSETTFHYHQENNIVRAEYSGGAIISGQLIAKVLPDNSLDMRYQHINDSGELMTGECVSRPEILADGRIRLHEKWRWTSGDQSHGESIIEEVKKLS